MMPEIAPGADIVLAARQETGEVDFRLLQSAIRQALAGQGLLVPSRPPDIPDGAR